jgi:hypothetical protein
MGKSLIPSSMTRFAGPLGADKDRAWRPMGSVDLLLRRHARIGRVGAAAPTKSACRAVMTARAPLRSGTIAVGMAFVSPMPSGR